MAAGSGPRGSTFTEWRQSCSASLADADRIVSTLLSIDGQGNTALRNVIFVINVFKLSFR